MERKLSKIYTPTIIILLFTLLVLPISEGFAKEIVSSVQNPVVVKDGDSIEIGSKRIRLMGLDAPEYTQHCKTFKGKLYPCGKQSTDFLKQLIKNRTVRCVSHKRDQYKRYLATCYVGNTDVNAEMIANGQAVVYLESAYHQIENTAKTRKAGIWNGIFMHPRLYRILNEQQKKKKFLH